MINSFNVENQSAEHDSNEGMGGDHENGQEGVTMNQRPFGGKTFGKRSAGDQYLSKLVSDRDFMKGIQE